jgi:hypothetical protein
MQNSETVVTKSVIDDLTKTFSDGSVDLPTLREAIRRAAGRLDAAIRQSLRSGAGVSFKSDRVGVEMHGVVIKVNGKSVSVRVLQPPTHAGQVWRVSPSLLAVTASFDVPKMDPVRAAQIAREACAEDRFGADDCDAKLLVEKDGVYLFFVETPAHGNFITVANDGVGRFVGEEDCGIPDARVRRFFGVGQYAEEVMDWVSGVPESSAAGRAEV